MPTYFEKSTGNKYVSQPDGSWKVYAPFLINNDDITKTSYWGSPGETLNKQVRLNLGNRIITIGPTSSSNNKKGNIYFKNGRWYRANPMGSREKILPEKSIKQSNGKFIHKVAGDWYWDNGRLVTKFKQQEPEQEPEIVIYGKDRSAGNTATNTVNTSRRTGISGNRRVPNYYNTIDEALAGYGLGTRDEIKNKYGVDLDEYASVQALQHAIGGLNEDNKFGVKTRDAFQNWLQQQGRANAGTLNTTPKIENTTVPNIQNQSNLEFTAPQRYNRADVRNRLREMGYNPYDLSGKQRRALRKAWNKPYEDSLMNMYGKYVPTPDTSNFQPYRYNPADSENWRNSINTYFGKYNGKIGKNSYWDTSKIAPAIQAVKEGLLNKPQNTIEQKLNNSNGGLQFVKKGGSLPSRNPIERFKNKKKVNFAKGGDTSANWMVRKAQEELWKAGAFKGVKNRRGQQVTYDQAVDGLMGPMTRRAISNAKNTGMAISKNIQNVMNTTARGVKQMTPGKQTTSQKKESDIKIQNTPTESNKSGIFSFFSSLFENKEKKEAKAKLLGAKDFDAIKQYKKLYEVKEPYWYIDPNSNQGYRMIGDKITDQFEIVSGLNTKSDGYTPLATINGKPYYSNSDNLRSTGAGVFVFGKRRPNSYNKEPMYLMTEAKGDRKKGRGTNQAFHGPATSQRSGLIDDGNDKNNKASFGCIQGKDGILRCFDEKEYNLEGDTVYVAPTVKGNYQYFDPSVGKIRTYFESMPTHVQGKNYGDQYNLNNVRYNTGY